MIIPDKIVSNLAFLQGQMQAYQQHVAKNQLLLNNSVHGLDDKSGCLWSGVLSWLGLDVNTNMTREISCNVMALPVNPKRDVSD